MSKRSMMCISFAILVLLGLGLFAIISNIGSTNHPITPAELRMSYVKCPITLENFGRIRLGMAFNEVKEILGEPKRKKRITTGHILFFLGNTEAGIVLTISNSLDGNDLVSSGTFQLNGNVLAELTR